MNYYEKLGWKLGEENEFFLKKPQKNRSLKYLKNYY